ncbi:MAG: hypothetical protein FWH27_18075 [Planctomycetaceae bacterium]|nr:hypothetical protein [Planctomycetaceae bacterium]
MASLVSAGISRERLQEIKYAHCWTPFMHGEPEPGKMDELHRQSLEFLRKQVNR